MKCEVCGAENSEMASFCKNCGQPLMGDAGAAATSATGAPLTGTVENTYSTPNPNAGFTTQQTQGADTVYTGTVENSGARMSKQDMFKYPQFERAIKTINGWVIFTYIAGAINILIELASYLPPVDGIIMIILAAIIHKTKNYGAALAFLILTILEFVYGIAMVGKPTGVLYIIGAVVICMNISKLNNAYKSYLQTGVVTTTI